MKMKQIASLLLCVISLCLPLSAKDIFVSLSTGKNKNSIIKKSSAKEYAEDGCLYDRFNFKVREDYLRKKVDMSFHMM